MRFVYQSNVKNFSSAAALLVIQLPWETLCGKSELSERESVMSVHSYVSNSN
uniref:Uncharacterized protein n=1 Tax=Kalanchoe fedtschenkoi TaxID=63787 RepID=A0A7N0VAP7_KALFE